MGFCPSCGVRLDNPRVADGWHVVRDVYDLDRWRVEEWKGGHKTGRLSEIYSLSPVAEAVRDALNLFYRS